MEFESMYFDGLLSGISTYLSINTWIVRVILAVAIILVGLILRHLFIRVLLKFLLKLTKRTKTSFDEMLIHAFEKPASNLLLGFIIWSSLSVALPLAVQGILNFSLKLLLLLMLFWFMYRASDIVIYFLERFLNRTDKKANPAVISLLGKTLKIFIIVFEIFSAIDLIGYDVSTIVAGLGIGGLAISLAAKDAAANLLGSITIMLDKTYSIGDWIKTDSVEGTVEEIGFRSTRIRTFADSLVSVPNSIMSNEPIINWSKMGKRRVTYNLHIPMDTPSEKVKTLLSRIRNLLNNNSEVSQEGMIAANMEGFDNHSLKLMIYYFTKTTSWVTYLQVAETINLDILKIFEEMHIPVTVPAQRLLVESGQSSIVKDNEVQ